MVSKLRRESQGLITVRIGDHEFPVAIRVGRKIYRICPVCHNIFASANGWTKHMEKYHPEFFDLMLTYRLNELKELTKVTEASKTGKSCIDRLLAQMPEKAVIVYAEHNDEKGGYLPVGRVELNSLINFMKEFNCKELNIRYLAYDESTHTLYLGKKVFHGKAYFRVYKDGKVILRFIFNERLMNAFIEKATLLPFK